MSIATRLRWVAFATIAVLVLAACGGGASGGDAAGGDDGGGGGEAASEGGEGEGEGGGGGGEGGGGDCDRPFNAEILEHREVPESLDPENSLPDIEEMTIRSTDLGTEEELEPTWWNTIEITEEQVREICEQQLTAVILDWDQVLYNQAIRSGIRLTLEAMGIELLRETSFSFDPNGLAGNLASVLPLDPDIIFTGGTIDPNQLAAIMEPARAQGAQIVTWGVGGRGWATGPGEDLTAVVGYDFYNLGRQMARAIGERYPDGANLGYLHWINNISAIHLREQGLLDGLAEYPNINIISDGGPPDPTGPNSGFNDPNAAQPATQAFLVRHPEVDVLFAAWEDPPALGEIAALRASGRESEVDIVTMDLGVAGAEQLSGGGTITVDMAQSIYDGGRAMALVAGLAAIGEETPPFVIVPTFAANADNYQDAWEYMHGPEFPCCDGQRAGGSEAPTEAGS
jgi:ribose transport system substrate-binding protein